MYDSERAILEINNHLNLAQVRLTQLEKAGVKRDDRVRLAHCRQKIRNIKSTADKVYSSTKE